MKFDSICVVSEGYPYKDDPQFSFVENLCRAFARKGIRVTVISPQSLLHIFLGKEMKHPKVRTYSEGGSAKITVFRPRFILLPYRFRKFNEKAFKRTVEKTYYKKKLNPEVCYGHFWNNAYYISDVAKKKNKPLFVASGEGNFDELEGLYTSPPYRAFTKDVTGVICVSSSCKDFSISYGMTTPDKCVVLPNAIDHNLFYVKDKKALRKQYGVPEHKFIVAFTGSFIHRKGSDRLSQAIELLKDEDICSFFIGAGQGSENLVPTCPGVLYCGKVAHEKIADYLNMADVFALPTLNEGCCNAIIEAMACGLPVISSDRLFNHDLLDKSNSILVDPLNIDEIAAAIKVLKNDLVLRQKLRDGALLTAKEQEINKRAGKILDFICGKIEESNIK